MVLRWIYQIWRIVWYALLGLLTALVLTGLVLYVSLQRSTVQHFLAHRVENAFNANYQGHISIGELGGDIPFNIILTDVRLTYAGPDSQYVDSPPVFKCDSVAFSVNLWDLIRRRINVTRFDIKRPTVRFNSMDDSTYTVMQALQRRKIDTTATRVLVFKDMNIYAPQLQMEGGVMNLDRLHHTPPNVEIPVPLKLDDVNMRVFLELNDNQRFLDIEHFHAAIPNTFANKIDLNGQLYNDQKILEFNRFVVKTGQSRLELNGDIDGVNLYKSDWLSQFKDAKYKLSLDSSRVYLSEFADIFPGLPVVNTPFVFNLKVQGSLSDLDLQHLDLTFNKSRLDANGQLKNLDTKNHLAYDLKLDTLRVSDEDLHLFPKIKWADDFKDWGKLYLQGSLSGNEDTMSVKSNLHFPTGNLQLSGNAQLKKPFRYSANLAGDNLVLDSLSTLRTMHGVININADVSGEGIDKDHASAKMNLSITNSRINHLPIDQFSVDATLSDGFLEPNVTFKSGSERLQGNGWIDLAGGEPVFSLTGKGSNINLRSFLPDSTFPSTSMKLSYKIRAQGSTLDRLYGEANLDIGQSVINGKDVQPQQIYIDLDSPEKTRRTLRLTSTYLDAIVKGTVLPSRIVDMTKYWSDYFDQHVRKEIMFQPDSVMKIHRRISSRPDKPVDVNLDLRLKNLAMLRNFLPDIPYLKSHGHLQTRVKADSSRILVSGGWKDDETTIDSVHVHSSQLMWTAGFSHAQSFKQYANLDLKALVDSLELPKETMSDLSWTFSMKNDSIENKTRVARIGKDVQVNLNTSSLLTDSTLVTRINNFVAGNEQYSWFNDGSPEITYDQNQRLIFNDFRLRNSNQFIGLNGKYGSANSDSLICSMRNINLQRVSDLINGDINFQGTLNAQFATHTLNVIRGLQGKIDVDRFSIDNRLVGDFSFNSQYDQVKNRFNTTIKLQTDTVKYHNYYEKNHHIVNNYVLKGYIAPPNPKSPADTLYHFDANFRSIDMWVINYIVPGVFDNIEGQSDGTGVIWGNKDDYHFHANFEMHHVHVVPTFVEADLYLTGPVILDRNKGVTFDNIKVSDNGTGRGLFYGNVDLNDFQPVKPLNLTMELYGLKFLNNKFDPDVPFYGSVTGTGTLKLTGTNEAPFLQTTQPITTTPTSKLSIPSLDETTVENQNSFIRFVKDFKSADDAKSGKPVVDVANNGQSSNNNGNQGKSFSQVFQLDLRFNAPQNSTVEFVFDPVTGEILTAHGGGQVNITLEDQVLQMYGRFDISGGSYQFVAGGIFSRLFYLENGGTILWDGDPTNPRINVTAYYRARPNLQPITGEDRRVPINLMLQLNGNLQSLTNNFYFQYPNNTFEVATPNSAVLSLLNSEDQKLLQATSLLLTGNFTPLTSLSPTGQQSIGSNLQNYAAGIGLGQILSSQINTLLNSNVSDLDVNLSMNSFQEADLAIALRLFNDRLILRREGLISGRTQNDIGDLGAEYRINKSLSVELFHRLDPTLSNTYGTFGNSSQLPSVNGIGLQYKVLFNSWNQLPNEVMHSFTNIFSKKKTSEPTDATAVTDSTATANVQKEKE